MPLRPRTTPAPSRTAGALARRVLTPGRLALGRTGAGAVMVTRPRAVSGLLGIDSATGNRMGWAVQMVGARELALGLGTRAALRRPDTRAARLWVAAGALTDAVDAVVLAGALGRGRLRTGPGAAFVAVATVSTALQAAALGERPADLD